MTALDSAANLNSWKDLVQTQNVSYTVNTHKRHSICHKRWFNLSDLFPPEVFFFFWRSLRITATRPHLGNEHSFNNNDLKSNEMIPLFGLQIP